MLTKLPKPITLIYCKNCRDVTQLDPKRVGTICLECGRRIAVTAKNTGL